MPGDSLDPTRLEEQLRELARHDEAMRPSSAVERVVMARWAERSAAGASVTPLPAIHTRATWARRRVAATAVAMAAVWLLLVALRTERSAPQTDAGASMAIPAAGAPVTVTPLSPADVSVEDRTIPEKTIEAVAPAAMPVRQGAPAETVGMTVDNEPFVRLLPLMEEELGALRIARVRLRGPAASMLGLDGRLPPMGPDEFVEADVLLGEDGVARAIRLTR